MLENFIVLHMIKKSECTIAKRNKSTDELTKNGDIFVILVELH